MFVLVSIIDADRTNYYLNLIYQVLKDGYVVITQVIPQKDESNENLPLLFLVVNIIEIERHFESKYYLLFIQF